MADINAGRGASFQMLRGVLIIHGNLKVHNANCHNHSYSHSQDDRES